MLRSMSTISQPAAVHMPTFINIVTSTFLPQDDNPKGEKCNNNKKGIEVLRRVTIIELLHQEALKPYMDQEFYKYLHSLKQSVQGNYWEYMKLLRKEIVCSRGVIVKTNNGSSKEIVIQMDIDYFHITRKALKNLSFSKLECLHNKVETVAQDDEELKNLIYADMPATLFEASCNPLGIYYLASKKRLAHFQIT